MAPPLLRTNWLRLALLILLLAAEALVLSLWLDNASLAGRSELLPRLIARSGSWALRGALGFAAIFFTFAYLGNRNVLAGFAAEAGQAPVRAWLLLLHAAAMAAFTGLSWALYGGHLGAVPANLIALAWLAAGLLGLVSGAGALVPLRLWASLFRGSGSLPLYALAAVTAACFAGAYSRELWNPMARLTFALAEALLRPFLAHIVADPAKMYLGSPKFYVEIAPECSGFEGMGLILAFGVVWLWMFRRECRFPHALLLLPAGVVTIYLLNAVRIAALILIGNAGAQRIALGGFHSQAGWIAFNVVALGFSIAAGHLRWFRSGAVAPVQHTGIVRGNPSAVYLLPFLAILGVGLLTGAVSGGFEWLYPLRFVAAAGCLWALRREYAGLGWKPGWGAVAIGAGVFALWIGTDALLGRPARDAMPPSLASASSAVRASWIAIRILAAAVTVPIAEELAFRGFLLRRFLSPDFETLPLRTFTWLGLIGSSVAFGLLHGRLWPAGIAAGLAYGWALVRRGRIGDAVAAHAVTNALLAVYVLAAGQWHLW